MNGCARQLEQSIAHDQRARVVPAQSVDALQIEKQTDSNRPGPNRLEARRGIFGIVERLPREAQQPFALERCPSLEGVCIVTLHADEEVARERDPLHIDAGTPPERHQHDRHRDGASRAPFDHVVKVIAARIVVVIAAAKPYLMAHVVAEKVRAREAANAYRSSSKSYALMIEPAAVGPRLETWILVPGDRESDLFGRLSASHCLYNPIHVGEVSALIDRQDGRKAPERPILPRLTGDVSGRVARYTPGMRILYGVVGEGMGHAMRSRVVLEHLVAQGHDIEIMASSRAVEFLKKRFEKVNRIHGLHMVYEDNLVARRKTLLSNLVNTGLRGVPANVAAYFDLVGAFKPELVISDFESWTYLYARAHGIPVISIDNMQIINRCKHDKSITKGHGASFRMSRAFVKGKLPGCNHYVISTFFTPPVRKKRTTLVPPILRSEIIEATPSRGEHLLVYQTGEGHEALLRALADSKLPCRIYGVKRDLKADKVSGNLVYRPFSETQFIEDLASCRAVIAGGGFTLMGEAVYLRKPMLAIPLGRQFEQLMNARYLEKLGYGKCVEHIDDPEVVHQFLAEIPNYEKNLDGYRQKGNRKLFEHLDGLLDRAAAGVL
jgi:uncharacterized protein (TIGR00661 family)